MSLAALLVHVADDEVSDQRLRLAVDLARRFEARLIGLAVAGIAAPMAMSAGGYVAGALIEAERKSVDEMLSAAAARFEALAAPLGTAAAWRGLIGMPAPVLAAAARAADLVVVGSDVDPSGHGEGYALAPADVVMQAGRPVLVVPPGVARLDLGRVLVAWRDTREARRALSDALPLLAAAEAVDVVQICASNEAAGAEASLADVAALLVAHGIAAASRAVVQHGEDAGLDLLGLAEESGAGLVVSGAYGHSRLREWALGGVTQSLLAHCDRPLLLSH
jgi:nucleotide-binding universal stress UspA family protein